MAYPLIKYNSATGSDSAPSDAVATSASTSTTVSGTAGTNTITFSSAVDLTGVLDDDSDYIWVDGSVFDRIVLRITGFTTSTDITAVTAVTVEDNLDNTISAVDWHINGTRQTIFYDSMYWKRGWVVEIDGTFTSNFQFSPCFLDSATSASTDYPFTLRASPSASSKPEIIESTGGARVLNLTREIQLKFEGVKILANGSGGANQNIQATSGTLSFVDCDIVNSSTTQPSNWIQVTRGTRMVNCYVSGGSAYTIFTQFNDQVLIDNCWLDGKGTLASTALVHLEGFDNVVSNTLVTNSAGAGIQFDLDISTATFWFCKNNTIYGSSGNGIEITGTPGSTTQPRSTFYIANNLVVGNGGYGMDLPTTALGAVESFNIDYNCVFNNTSGGYNGISAGANDITITASPFVNSSGDNYALNDNVNGGALLKNAGRSALPTGN